MPELPEVETIAKGLKPLVENKKIIQATIRQPQLRWRLDDDFAEKVEGRSILNISRRSKYLIFKLDDAHLLWHLGMSGSLGFSSPEQEWQKHQHLGLTLSDEKSISDKKDVKASEIIQLRYLDPRRFGFVIWTDKNPLEHKLLVSLAPEPLSAEFNAQYLYPLLQKRTQPIKTFIMDAHKVVGVGNIYANEALFAAKISPLRKAGDLSFAETELLVTEIKKVLQKALKAGGTTLKDFKNIQGKAGYFSQELQVYGREGQKCTRCAKNIIALKIGQRSSFYCPTCQA